MGVRQFFTRAQWGARGRLGSRTGVQRRCIIHTEAGAAMPATATVAQEQARMRAVDAFHLSLGWSGGFGYSEAWFPSGRVYEGRGVRRPGAHTVGLNDEFAVMLPGHGDRTAMTELQIAAGRARIRTHIVNGDLAAGYVVSGHRDHIPPGQKSCPGNRVYPQLGRLRGVTATTAVQPASVPPATEPSPTPTPWRDPDVLTADSAPAAIFEFKHLANLGTSLSLSRNPNWDAQAANFVKRRYADEVYAAQTDPDRRYAGLAGGDDVPEQVLAWLRARVVEARATVREQLLTGRLDRLAGDLGDLTTRVEAAARGDVEEVTDQLVDEILTRIDVDAVLVRR
jgi:hypothetical protein